VDEDSFTFYLQCVSSGLQMFFPQKTGFPYAKVPYKTGFTVCRYIPNVRKSIAVCACVCVCVCVFPFVSRYIEMNLKQWWNDTNREVELYEGKPR